MTKEEKGLVKTVVIGSIIYFFIAIGMGTIAYTMFKRNETLEETHSLHKKPCKEMYLDGKAYKLCPDQLDKKGD